MNNTCVEVVHMRINKKTIQQIYKNNYSASTPLAKISKAF